MTRSLQQVLNQIEKLEKQAKALRDKEKIGVVARIREAVAHYEITPAELFGAAPPAKTRKVRAAAAGKLPKSAKKAPSVAKYTDGTGRTWSGVGKRPNWFKDALAAGKAAEDLLIKARSRRAGSGSDGSAGEFNARHCWLLRRRRPHRLAQRAGHAVADQKAGCRFWRCIDWRQADRVADAR